ncbi:prenyltransferase [Streptomyces sp. NPDC059853]|uniref:prenyltransferase n=1 Tax=Streptomyces sp. NPDC059853 TaxID=3346973 RepID=UPI003648D39B
MVTAVTSATAAATTTGATAAAAGTAATAGRTGRLGALIRLGRPKFLFHSLLALCAGTELAAHAGAHPDTALLALVLAFGCCAHLMTYYCNDYFDLEADRANPAPTAWSGGSRVLTDRAVTPTTALGTAFVLLLASVVLLTLLPTPGTRLLAAGFLLLAWFYTAPPLRLNYRAVGELACALSLHGLLPLLACLAQLGGIPATAWACVGALAAFQYLQLLVLNLADLHGDLRVGKITVAGVLGPRRTVRLYAAGQALTYAAVAAAGLTGTVPTWTAVLLLATLPLPWAAARAMRTGDLTTPTTTAATLQLPLASAAVVLGCTLAAWDGRITTWLALKAAALTGFAVWWLRTRRRTPATGC